MSEPARVVKIRLGDVMVAQKVITAEQLAQALEQQKRSGRRLGRILVENGLCSEEQIAAAVARQLGIPHVNLKFYNLNNEVVRALPESQARRFRAVLLEDRRIQDVEVEIARPGEDCRIGVVFDRKNHLILQPLETDERQEVFFEAFVGAAHRLQDRDEKIFRPESLLPQARRERARRPRSARRSRRTPR